MASRMSTLSFAGLLFAVAGLAGPALRLVTWPPSRPEGFVYDLVLYLWPTQPLAVIEATSGKLLALLLSVGGNVLLFTVVGLLAGAAAKHPLTVLALYAAWSAVLLLVGLWGAGFEKGYLSVYPLAVALLLYALPFWIVFRRGAS